MTSKGQPVSAACSFDYEKAFSRNIGFVTESELQQLRQKRIAIAGMGGVGGIFLITLSRLGIGNFNIADIDHFELQNFNRQFGASLHTLNHPKVEVLAEMAKGINPEMNLKSFTDGVTESNLDEFLRDIDLCIDALDLFAIDIRIKVYKRCRELGIPIMTAGPLGMGTAYIIFMPDKMSYEDYFHFDDLDNDDERCINFLLGVAPKAFFLKYLVEPNGVNLKEHRGSSTPMGVDLCAGVIGAETLKILLKRGPVYPAPYYHFFDAYLCKYYRGWLPWGNNHPMQRIKRFFVKKKLSKNKIEERAPVFSLTSSTYPLEKILDLTRWTPSGDNYQPWRFKITDEHNALIYIDDTTEKTLFDFAGIPTIMNAGMLLETFRIAASHFGYNYKYQYKKIAPHKHVLEVTLVPDGKVTSDPLFPFIAMRSVNRNRYQLRPLTAQDKHILTAAIGDEFEIRWFESLSERWEMSYINLLTSNVRLRIRDLYESLKDTIDFDHQYSAFGMPVNALGLSSLSKKVMTWAIQSWPRINFMNRYLAAPYTLGIELDMIPGIFCSAHFAVLPKERSDNYPPSESLIRAGQVLQRFWLTLTQSGLAMQPSAATMAFVYYVNNNIPFTTDKSILARANKLADQSNKLFGSKTVLFKGRVGVPSSPIMTSRSVRKPLSDLLIND